MNNNVPRNAGLVASFAAIIGFILVLFQLFNNSVGLTIGVVAVGSVAIIGYGIQSFDKQRQTLTPEICMFCWLFIVVMNMMRLMVGL